MYLVLVTMFGFSLSARENHVIPVINNIRIGFYREKRNFLQSFFSYKIGSVGSKIMSSYGTMENGGGRSLNQVFVDVDGCECTEQVVVRMAVPNRPLWHFVDDGEEIELYVTFPDGVSGIPESNRDGQDNNQLTYPVDIAGKRAYLKPLITFTSEHCKMFKATSVVSSATCRNLRAGQPVLFSFQCRNVGTDDVMEIDKVTEPNMPVYYQPVWKKLQERDDSLIRRIREYDGRVNLNAQGEDETRNNDSESLLERSFNRSTTPQQVARDDFFLYYTRRTCRPFFESENPFIKVVRELMVSPLTNFTGLSLYFQLYLVEIFHVKFYTKLGHYLCMPMIVLLMATWFAQWRYIGNYRIEDVSVFILNGTFVFLCVLQLWYLVWGCLYRMYLFGIFMVWPLFFMYMLANMLFQIIVINSYWADGSDLSVKDVREIWGQNSSHWHDFITLAHFGVKWYLNPLLLALVFCALQALSHLWEEKLPPRVSQTAHWLDISTILKRNGYVHFGLIAISQTIFGTFNEFFASPRLLPLLVLRICYNLGYEEKQWIKFRRLVDECLKFGDPAIDYIGRGGARWPQEFNKCEPEHLSEKVETIERGLSKKKKRSLKDPNFLKNNSKFTKELQYYVLLRHRLTKYKIQVEAYGPFTPQVSENLELDNVRMRHDFEENPAFRIFLEEARSHFAEMEFNFVQECKLNRVFL